MSCCFWWNFPSLKCWVYSHVSVLSRNQRQAWPAIVMCRSPSKWTSFPPKQGPPPTQPSLLILLQNFTRIYDSHLTLFSKACLLQLQLQIRLLINPINHALGFFAPQTSHVTLNFWWELSPSRLAQWFPRLWWATILPPFTTGASRLEPLWVRHVSDGRRQGISRYAQKDKYIIQMMVYSDILCCTGWLMFGANCVWEM